MKKYYRFLHGEQSVRKNSSSGGAFTEISDIILNNDGVVYGCVMDEKLNVKHIRTTNTQDRDKMRGSKYIQSDIKEVFQQVAGDLNNEKTVMFTGTPCQVLSVYNYLKFSKINTERLLTLEVTCHGVGSKLFFEDYAHTLEKKYRGKAVKVNFRAKHYKGQKQGMEIAFDNEKKYNAVSTKYDWFYSIYLKNLILRPSCYECPFAKKERFADVTIADHWGYKDEEAYSLLISNTLKGKRIIDIVLQDEKNEIKEISEQDVKQSSMISPSKRPVDRDKFWKTYKENGYLSVQKQFGNNTILGKTKIILAKFAQKTHTAGILKSFIKRK